MSWLLAWVVRPCRAVKPEVLQVVKKWLTQRERENLGGLLKAMEADLPFARIRGADFLAELFEADPRQLDRYRDFVFYELGEYKEVRCRWAFARIAPHLVGVEEAASLVPKLKANLGHKSQVLCFLSLQGLYQLTRLDPKLKATVYPLLMAAAQSSSPSVRGHGQRLLAKAGLGGS